MDNQATKKVCLSGIGGSIGVHTFAHIMHNTDWHVVGIDSFRHKGLSDRLAVYLNDHPQWKERLTMVTHDLAAPFSQMTKNKIGHVDYIISMASLSDVEVSIEDPVPFIQNNVNVVLNMLEFAREAKPEAFIQISTDETYGACATKDEEGAEEWAPILPSNPYAASKACQEAIAISYWRTYDVPVIITNTMNNFSEMQQSNKFPVMVQKWIQNGEKVIIHGEKRGDTFEIGSRSYIHSRNFADALVFILKNLPPHRHAPDAIDMPDRYNIAGDRQLDNLELAKLIGTLMGKPDFDYEVVDAHTLRPGHDRHYRLKKGKLESLGWESPVSFEESLKNVIDWQIKHPAWIN